MSEADDSPGSHGSYSQPQTLSLNNENESSQINDSGYRASDIHASGMFTKIREASGTVYGDIGTSVLYTVMELTRETIRLRHHHLGADEFKLLIAHGGPDLVTRNEALGSLSLIFWALVFLTVKYDLLIMRADNRGEGGDFALWGLLRGHTGKIFGLGLLGFLVASAAGLLSSIDNRRLSRVAKLAGAPQSHSAGLELHVKLGDRIERGQPLMTLHGESRGELEYALDFAQANPDILKVGPQ